MHSDRHQFATNAGIDFGIIEFFRDVLPILGGFNLLSNIAPWL